MFIVARLPANGYTPGETIPLDLKTVNKSDKTIYKFIVRIIKVGYFEAYTQTYGQSNIQFLGYYVSN